jgi:hypothetical protein
MTFKNKSKKEPSHYFMIKYYNHDTPMKRFIIDGGGRTEAIAIKKAESNMLDHTVEWAVLYDKSKNPVHYYHYSKGIQCRLSVTEYRMCLTPNKQYSIFIVPTDEARKAGKSAKRLNQIPEDDICLYEGPEVKKIEVYYSGKLVAVRQKGAYL